MILDSFNIKPEDCVLEYVPKKSMFIKFLEWLK
jgi:hypothetical protein